MGRSRGGLTTKIHAVVDAKGLPIRLGLTPGQADDGEAAMDLLNALPENAMVCEVALCASVAHCREFEDWRMNYQSRFQKYVQMVPWDRSSRRSYHSVWPALLTFFLTSPI